MNLLAAALELGDRLPSPSPLDRTCRLQFNQMCFQNAATVAGTINDVRSLQWIAGQVVQLWQRKIHELLAPDDDAGQRRPAAVQ